MMRSANRFTLRACGVLAVVVYGVLGLTAPAGALVPQPIDASEQGPLAFVAMTVMCGLFVLSLFYMDRVRQRRERKPKHAAPPNNPRCVPQMRTCPTNAHWGAHSWDTATSGGSRGQRGGGLFERFDIVGETGEQRLVTARREVHARREQRSEHLGVARS